MTITWTGRQTHDRDTLEPVLQATVNGASVSVFVSSEAIQDYGIDAVKAVAEGKITAEASGGVVPQRVTVTTRDLQR